MSDVLVPAGPQAAHIAALWWFTLALCAVVFVAIVIAVIWAVWRAPRADAATAPEIEPPPRREKNVARGIAAAVAVSAIGLFAILVASIATDRALAQLPRENGLPVHITAHQWWWEITYDDAEPARIFTTANELRIPVGRTIVARLDADDVIHSLWVPSLHGKKDLIPGRTSLIEFRADQPGRFRGQCAEFCGLQHAFMAIEVVAMAPADFEAWAQAQRKPAPEPADDTTRRGRDLFVSGSCMLCHAIAGTTANAHKAPDLTHVASRYKLAAGRLVNTPEDLAEWIEDPQRIKPGANMPAHPLAADDMKALVAYLETLK